MLVIYILAVASCLVIGGIIGAVLIMRKSQGSLKCGTNTETGQTVYRIEFDIPLSEVPKYKRINLRVEYVTENLGVNHRLYDLESEGIKRD